MVKNIGLVLLTLIVVSEFLGLIWAVWPHPEWRWLILVPGVSLAGWRWFR